MRAPAPARRLPRRTTTNTARATTNTAYATTHADRIATHARAPLHQLRPAPRGPLRHTAGNGSSLQRNHAASSSMCSRNSATGPPGAISRTPSLARA